MNRILPYIIVFCAFCLLFTGCLKETSAFPEKETRVQFLLPGSYSIPAASKSGGESMRAADHPDLTDDMLTLLEDGSTLWLAVYEKQDGGYSDEPAELKSYVVRRSGSQYSTLYACEVNPDGSVKSESGTPLYLEVGKTYKFRAVSPARELTDGMKLHVNNGDYLLSTDDRYTQTSSREIEVKESDDPSGVTYVRLNPLLQQTARMRFTIAPGENVHRLGALPAGIEISGVQDDVVNGNEFNWSTTDSLKMYLGSKHSRITIKEFSIDEHGCVVGQTALLPTDATSSSIVVLLNLSVNGVNSQFVMLLNDMLIEAAHSYNFFVDVKVEDGVTVAVWQSQSWGWDMDLQ